MADDIRRPVEALADSPYLMIGLDGTSDHSQPMTAQLDKRCERQILVLRNKQNRLAPGGPAMAQFSSKGTICSRASTSSAEPRKPIPP